jgi:hypothetical protein
MNISKGSCDFQEALLNQCDSVIIDLLTKEWGLLTNLEGILQYFQQLHMHTAPVTLPLVKHAMSCRHSLLLVVNVVFIWSPHAIPHP